ncbi:hypothetical protein C8J57DRAFT_1268701 [Mycena rebaudengoi]|nr:hypothetical protein C8J57DRAFT_1268701 [Mycena rebaudengoi]
MLEPQSPSLVSHESSPTGSEIIEKLSSSRPCTPPSPVQTQPKQQSSSSRERPLAELIGEEFPRFDANTELVLPWQKEDDRDTTFQRELNAMLLNLVLETHAWSSARPVHETHQKRLALETTIQNVISREDDQERTRQHLNQFVAQIRAALAALTSAL